MTDSPSQRKGIRFGSIFASEDKKKELERLEKRGRDEIASILSKMKDDQNKISLLSLEDKISLVAKKANVARNQSINLEATISDLCTPEGIKRRYLNKDFKAVAEYFRLQKKDKGGNFWASKTESKEESIESDDFGTHEESEEGLNENEELDSLYRTKVNQQLKIKLIITEIHRTDKQRTYRKLVSPLAKTLNLSTQFGIFHSALSIGPWYLEWVNDSLCVPRKPYSTQAIMAMDIESSLETVDCDFVIDKLSEVISRWNVSHQYDKIKNNCQHFVDEILAALDISPTVKCKGQLGSFLNNLRTKGECEIGFNVSPTIREKLSIKEDHLTFETHKQLDEFVQNLEKHFPKFSTDFRDDMQLLKSFDRAFWLRHMKEKTKAQYAPLRENIEGEIHLCCPFGDPLETKTFGGMDWVEIPPEKDVQIVLDQ